jgi:hypothetical protein
MGALIEVRAISGGGAIVGGSAGATSRAEAADTAVTGTAAGVFVQATIFGSGTVCSRCKSGGVITVCAVLSG